MWQPPPQKGCLVNLDLWSSVMSKCFYGGRRWHSGDKGNEGWVSVLVAAAISAAELKLVEQMAWKPLILKAHFQGVQLAALRITEWIMEGESCDWN